MWTPPLRNLIVAVLLLLVLACGSSETALRPDAAGNGHALQGQSEVASPSVPQVTSAPADAASREHEWVADRMLAVAALFDLSQEGRDLLRRLDVRQMRGQPGFFGSYGFSSWTGVGEAKPSPIMHELSHAYWGAYPVSGHPELTWDIPDGGGLSGAMEAYHRDVLDFMAQPAGHYELFRSYLRNIPGLSAENLDPLWHSVEADVVGNVAGDLDLLPPVLRKYWDRFLEPGPWGSWYEVAAWFSSLDGRQLSLANQYMGFQHLDLRQYDLPASERPGPLLDESASILEREERQRLWDFADQFELLLGAPEYEENFDFWRGYLRDMQHLHRRNPGYLESFALPNATAISDSLGALQALEGESPDSRAVEIARLIDELPFLLHFLPALDNSTLLSLFAGWASPPDARTLKGTDAFVSRLERLTPAINDVLLAAGEDPARGAAALSRFLNARDFEERRDLRLFFELLRDADGDVAREATEALDDPMKRRLLESIPAELRALLDARSLLDAVGVTTEAGLDELSLGIDMLIEFPSGNFRVDEPYLGELYDVVAIRAEQDPEGMLDVISGSKFPLEGFIRRHPETSVAVLAGDLDVAAELVKRSDPVIFPPARFVYRLISADPAFAAQVVAHLDASGERELVVESLAHFAYDAARLAAVPRLPVSLTADGRFLQLLLDGRGHDWLLTRLAEVVTVFEGRVDRGEVPPDFSRAYKDTLKAALSTLPDADSRLELLGIVDEAFLAAPAP